MDIGTAVKLRIEQLCKERDISINMLADMCGIARTTIVNITSGRNIGTNIITIKKLCDGLKISIVEFFDCELFNNLEQEIE